jgi:hypothetical protein
MSDTPEKKPTPADLGADLAAHREGPPLPPAAERLARMLAARDLAARPPSEGGMAIHDAAALLGVDKESPLDALRAWGWENTRRSRDSVADALRRALADQLSRGTWAKLPPDVLAELRRWAAKDAEPENLVRWLDEQGGWDKVDGDAAEAALVTAARAVAEADGLQDGLASVLWNTGAPDLVLLYDTPRADLDKPDVRERIARQTAPHIDPLAALLAPEGRKPPDKADVLLGLDALKAGLHGLDWGGLGLCLTDKAARAGDWLGRLAVPWMDERRKRAAEAARALPLVLQPRNVIIAPSTGAAFLRFPSMLKDAGAWCGALVPVDGDTIFAEEPDLAAAPLRVLKDADGADVQLYKPRAWTVAAERRLAGPRQPTLPGLVLDPQLNPDLGAFLAVTATGAAVVDRLPGLCAKLLPLLFALCPLDGTPVKGPVKDLVKLLYPNWKKRRQMAGDVDRVGAAAAALRALRIVEALPTGALRVYPVTAGGFYDIPTGPGQEPEACLRLNPELAALAIPVKGKGDFVLVNLSRLMELDAQSPDRIAVALRLAAYWHTCKQRTADGRRVFLPERLDYLPVDGLLVESNAPGPVADVITGADLGRAGKVKLSEARARLVDATLPALVKAGYLDTFDARRPDRHAGRSAEAWLVKVPPPADYLEASRKTASTRRPPPEGRPRRK